MELFATRGFNETTLDDIAAAMGVGRRTLFRYYPSKNDIVWGDFSEHLSRLRGSLFAADPREPLMEVLRRAVLSFNDTSEAALPDLRLRLTLITTVPALQGHSLLRYQEWCTLVAEFVGHRLDLDPEDLVPQTIAGSALAASLAAYRHWICHEDADLLTELDRALRLLAEGFDEQVLIGRHPASAGVSW
jgi:mycofactocin system transcriptional regulator